MVTNRFAAAPGNDVKRRTRLKGISLPVVIVVAGLTSASLVAQPAIGQLTIIAPAAPGGGWDQLAREMQRELETERLVPGVQVENVPGAAGTIGLAQFINGRRGDGTALLVNGLVMLGAILWNDSPVSIAQVTPIARLTGEYEIVAVPAASPHRDMQSLVRALRENAAAVSWGGGSAGGTDHILAGLIVAAAGVDPRRTNYIAFSGGGEAVTALLGGQVTAGISGYSEFAQHIESGRLRAIGISAPARSSIVDAPTLVEQGLDVELENWRAVMAPPGLTDTQRQTITGVVDRMAHSDTWRARLTKLGWSDSYLAGPALEQFLDTERTRVARIVSSLRGTSGDVNAQAGEWVLPVLVFAGVAWVLVALFLESRSATALQRETKDEPAGVVADSGSDGASGSPMRVAFGLIAFVTLLNLAGFVAAGTALFACTASAFGSRRWLRDALIGLTLCAAVYIAFTYGLHVTLPSGVLSGTR
jgi:putative tricarboxylic transport membrane protein